MEPRTRKAKEKIMSDEELLWIEASKGGEVFCNVCKEWHAVNEGLDFLGISENAYGEDRYEFVCPTTKEKSSGPGRIYFGEA